MKSVLLLILSVVLATVTIKAQQINVGLKAGLNIYNIHGSIGEQPDNRISFHVGLLAHMHINEHFGIQPEIDYSSQGATKSIGNIDNTLSLGYLNIPIIFQYMFGNGFRIEAGPQLGILLNATAQSGGMKSNAKDEVEDLDFAIGAGISYIHVLSGFGIDIRYNLGLSNIAKDASGKYTNTGLQLGIFYHFNHNS